MAIELNRIGWEDAPSEQTPLDSGNLKQMEQNTEDAINELDDKKTANMTTYYGKGQVYSHGASVSAERIWMDKYVGDGKGYLTKGVDGVLIEAGVNHVNIKAMATVRLNSANQAGDVQVSIRKNGTILAIANFFHSGFGPFSYAPFSNYVEVKEGDLIQLYIEGANDLNVIDDPNFRYTQLYVEVVD